VYLSACAPVILQGYPFWDWKVALQEEASTEGDNLVVHVLYYPISFEIYSNRGMSLHFFYKYYNINIVVFIEKMGCIKMGKIRQN
jgi:hypothetical protein